MTRPNKSRTMNLESLENRETLTAAPNATAQYALELVNLARTNPTAAATWIQNNINANDVATLKYYGVNLQAELNAISSSAAQPPLAWNDTLAQTAQNQSNDQATNNFQGHDSSNGTTFTERLTNAGYLSTSSGEDAYAYATSVDNAIKAFLIDWGVADKGHRRNILQPGVSNNDAYREIGIGITNTGNAANTPGKVGPMVVTMDFGAQSNSSAQLLGVAYNDADHNGMYTPGEGAQGIVIEATNLATGQVTSTTSSSAGGYQMALDPGSYQVVDKDNGVVLNSQTVNIGTVNVKVDFNNIPDTPPTAPAPAYVAPTNNTVKINVQSQTQSAPKPTVQIQSKPTPAPIMNPNQLESFVNSWVGFRGGQRIW